MPLATWAFGDGVAYELSMSGGGIGAVMTAAAAVRGSEATPAGEYELPQRVAQVAERWASQSLYG